jgi:hypothetical protein
MQYDFNLNVLLVGLFKFSFLRSEGVANHRNTDVQGFAVFISTNRIKMNIAK